MRAPRRSRSALVATVVPCANRVSPVPAPTARAAATTDSSCLGAVGTLAVRIRPSSTSTASVKVPPTSTPRIATSVLCTGMRVRAFLFDFDGLILDTELAARAGWERLYREHGHELPADLWATLVGTTHAPWDPMTHLEELVGEPLEREALNERRYAHEIALIEAEELRPGIADYLAATRRHGLKRAIVYSSTRRWVDMHRERLQEATGWDAICTADRDPARAKPAPTLYLEALEQLGVPADEAVAFEDSPNGVLAAKAAAVFCLAIPNEVTRELGLEEAGADLVLDSLADLAPEALFSRLEEE